MNFMQLHFRPLYFFMLLLIMVMFSVTVAAQQLDVEALKSQFEALESASANSLLNQQRNKALVIPKVVTPREVSRKIDRSTELSSSQSIVKAFGYDLFAGVPSTFAPVTEIPVTSDYLIGPGDTVYVQLFGKKNNEYSLLVSRDGSVHLPGIGALPVSGLGFDEMKSVIERHVAEQFIGVKVSITMGPLRSIRVFILGDVYRPGSYTVSALSTMTNALFVSGGVSSIGSLRNIQLKRSGKVMATLDLYDLLLRGDTQTDARIQPGDVIFVPPVGRTATIQGQVLRPAIYELRSEKTLQSLLALAGGLTPNAFPDEVRIERVEEGRSRSLINVDLRAAKGKNTQIKNGDRVQVYSVLDKMDNVVLLKGHVHRPLRYQWQQGLRLSDLVPSADVLKPNMDLGYLLIRREQPPLGQFEVLSSAWSEVLAAPGGEYDLLLMPRDQIIAFGLGSERQAVLKDINQRLLLEASSQQAARLVTVEGHVRFPGRYPLTEQMRISQLLVASGRLNESAYSVKAELTRRVIVDGQLRDTIHVEIDLAAILAGDPEADLLMLPYDHLTVREMPQWQEQGYVELQGEVRFPGRYPIRRGETLAMLLDRAGGLTEMAFTRGAVFLRESLRQREQQHLDQMAQNLESDMAQVAIAERGGEADQQSLQLGGQLLQRLRATRAVGRLVFDPDLGFFAHKSKEGGIVLRDGDRLFVPRASREVTVLGEVFFPTSHVFESGQAMRDYVKYSGGLTAKADAGRLYVIRANGRVEGLRRGWFSRGQKMMPGDTIIVPLDIDRVTTMRFWTDTSRILYQLAVTAASLKTVGVF